MDYRTLHLKLTDKEAKVPAPVNLEWPERLTSVVLGTKITFSGLFGVFKHPFRSAAKILAGGYLVQRGVSGYCSLYAKLGKTTTEPVNINIRYTFGVNRPRLEVYDFWRRLENLPLFMSHLENVESIDSTHSHWEAKIPGNLGNISWNAEIVKDIPGSFIGWQSMPDSSIENYGKVEFDDAPGDEGTIVKVVISYLPPAGGIGTGLAKMLNPLFEKIIREDVLNFKTYIEAIQEHHESEQMDEPDITIITIETDEPPQTDDTTTPGNI